MSIRAVTWRRRLLATGAVAVVTCSAPALAVAAEGPPRYVALGDSVAAGLGLPLSGDPGDPGCGVSDLAYPRYLAATVGGSAKSVACSGATIDQGILGPQTAGGVVRPPQLDQAFSAGVPDGLTVTVGANDLDWSGVVSVCHVRVCGTPQDTVAVAARLKAAREDMVRLLGEIRSRAEGDDPLVVLTGYYNPFAATPCPAVPGLTAAEIEWMRQRLTELNQMIREVAESSSTSRFAPVDFTGHDLCSAQPWVQGLLQRGRYHPTVEGQSAIARAVYAVLD